MADDEDRIPVDAIGAMTLHRATGDPAKAQATNALRDDLVAVLRQHRAGRDVAMVAAAALYLATATTGTSHDLGVKVAHDLLDLMGSAAPDS